MLKFWKQLLTPNVIAILMFENGRKFGLGVWIIVIATVLALQKVLTGDLWFLSTLVGGSIATGGNMFDKWIAVKKGEEPKEPAQ